MTKDVKRKEPVTSGRLLKEAREERGLTVGDVANELRLRKELVEALEANDTERLPPPTFVAGYLRNYAKLLELPADSVVSHFLKQSGKDGPTLVSNIRHADQVGAGDPRVRMVTYGIVLGLLILLGMWWGAQRDDPLSRPISGDVADPLISEPAVTEEIRDSSPVAADATPAESEGADGRDVSGWEVLTQEESRTQPVPVAVGEPAGETVSEEGMDESAGSPETAVSVPAVSEPTAAVRTREIKAPPLLPETPQTELVLEFSSDCWAEIDDAAGRSLVYDLMQGGERVVLHGEAPFRVFLGYAPGASIRYQGEVFDHTPFRRGDIARFRIGNADDNRPRVGVN